MEKAIGFVAKAATPVFLLFFSIAMFIVDSNDSGLGWVTGLSATGECGAIVPKAAMEWNEPVVLRKRTLRDMVSEGLSRQWLFRVSRWVCMGIFKPSAPHCCQHLIFFICHKRTLSI